MNSETRNLVTKRENNDEQWSEARRVKVKSATDKQTKIVKKAEEEKEG